MEALGAPPWFWARGDRALLQSIQGSVCVVGSRKTDAHGARMARHVVTAAVRDGWSVVSGGALGIDAVAHETCVAEGGKTIAVLPSGLDEPYPRRHRGLFDRIVQSGGLLLSPFPPGHKPRTWHFARRNVVMAAMSEVTVVVRAAPQSGSLITARAARSLGRRLLAVPGDAWRPELRGTAELLAEGAEVLVNPMEPGLGRRRPSPRCTALAQPTMSPFAARVAQALRAGPRHAEELAQALGEPLHGLHMPLLELELEGLIVRDGPEVYALTSAGVSV